MLLVASARDGRVLARWPIDRPPAAITQDDFQPPLSEASWSPDGRRVIHRATSVTVWRATHSYRTSAITRFVRRNVPWRVVGGRLAWVRNGQLRGTILRDGLPAQGVKILVEIRSPHEVGSAPLNWESTKTRISTRDVSSDAYGKFALGGLPPGEYTLTIVDGAHRRTITAYVSPDEDPIHIDLAR